MSYVFLAPAPPPTTSVPSPSVTRTPSFSSPLRHRSPPLSPSAAVAVRRRRSPPPLSVRTTTTVVLALRRPHCAAATPPPSRRRRLHPRRCLQPACAHAAAVRPCPCLHARPRAATSASSSLALSQPCPHVIAPAPAFPDSRLTPPPCRSPRALHRIHSFTPRFHSLALVCCVASCDRDGS
jgi:hypothetical protein